MYQPRYYRDKMGKGMSSFEIIYKETDLWIAVDIDDEEQVNDIKVKTLDFLKARRFVLEEYISKDNNFFSSLVPVEVSSASPEIIRIMADAAALADVGPMAAVAGVFSELTARYIHSLGVNGVIVENGGDIFIIMDRDVTLSIHAGKSSFSESIVFKVEKENMPIAVCTSAGNVGHSLSFGNADAVVVMARKGAVADVFATSIANKLKSVEDIPVLIKIAQHNSHIKGILLLKDDKIGLWGNIQLCSA